MLLLAVICGLISAAGCEDARRVVGLMTGKERVIRSREPEMTKPEVTADAGAVLPEDAGAAGKPRGKAGPLRVMYVDGSGNVVKVASEDDVPPEYRGQMIGLAGSLSGRSGYTIMTPVSVKAAPIAPSRGAQRAAPVPASGAAVIVYSTSWCGACKLTKAYLAEKKIPFEERDIEKDTKAAREFAGYGGRGVPLIIVNGKTLRGFNAAAIDREIGR